MNVQLRRSTPNDIAVLLEIEQESFTRPHWSGDDFLKYRCTLAEVDGQIAGFIVAREVFATTNGSGAEREILNIAVAPPFRRLGIATLLLGHELREHAVSFLEVRESNTAARTLYRKLGFLEIGTRKQYYENPVETAIVMRMK